MIRPIAALALSAFACLLEAQQPTASSVDVLIKPGHTFGSAVAHIDGKPKPQLVTRRATHAWLAEQAHSIIVVAPPEKGHPQPQLRIFDLDSGERHTLGDLPLDGPEFLEVQNGDDPSVFLLKGNQNGQPAVYLADTTAIHTRLIGATSPTLTGDIFRYIPAGGSTAKEIPRRTALGEDLFHRIFLAGGETLQLLPDGRAVVVRNGKPESATWLTDGEALFVHSGSRTDTILRSSLQQQSGVPAETRLTLRLLQPLNSRTDKAGKPVEAALILPAVVDGHIYLPQNTHFTGHIVKVRGVHYGFGHESAAVTLHFEHAQVPNGPTLPVDVRVVQVENARETVDAGGTIKGQRATATLGHSAEGQITGLAQVDPIAYVALTADSIAVLGFAESEILYPAGTEMIGALNLPLLTAATYPRTTGREATSLQAELPPFLQSLPFRTTTQVGDHPSDLTSIVFLGTPEALKRAFAASGWVMADSLTAASTFSTLRSISGTETYNEAPMSTLLLNHQEPITTLTKTTNTFNARHHLRVFPTGKTFDGKTVLTASTTQDTGIAFSRKKRTFIHVIDQYIDNERDKVVNDLIFTRCVDALQMVPRPWVPRDAYNSTGDRLRTDGEVAVLRLNDCNAPVTTTPTPAPRPNKFERSVRNTMLTLRSQLYRSNLIYQGIDYSRKGFNLFSEHDAPANLGNWYRTEASDAGDEESSDNIGRPQSHPAKQVMERDTSLVRNRWAPPKYEIALHGGYTRFRSESLEADIVLLVPGKDTDPLYIAGLFDEVGDGWTAGFSVTVNTWKWVSNEFSYFRQQGKYRLGAFAITIPAGDTPISDSDFNQAAATVGLTTRQFEYNSLVHFRPPSSRWRPYVAAGPVLQLIALADAPLKRPSSYYTLGLKNLGLFKAAFDFGNTPPLDGGGIFQPGLQYGAGIKYRVTPRFTMRMDWRETWSRNPRIIRDSYESFLPDTLPDGYDVLVLNGPPDSMFFQQRATMGFAFTF